MFRSPQTMSSAQPNSRMDIDDDEDEPINVEAIEDDDEEYDDVTSAGWSRTGSMSPNALAASQGGPGVSDEAKKTARAQHNALERRRRDNIKDMYDALRVELPGNLAPLNSSNATDRQQQASRAVILKRTIEEIETRTAEQEDAQRRVELLEAEQRRLQEELANAIAEKRN